MTWHILIAEPNQNYRESLRAHLSAQGFEIIQSSNGDETWELIQTQNPDLVLMRVALPGLSSEEIVRRVRANSRLAGISILCLGGPVTTDELVNWFRLGVDNYIEDSFSIQLTVAQIKAHLRRLPIKSTAIITQQSIH